MDTDDAIHIGIVGQFDVDSFDQQVRLRIARHELTRRAPTAITRAFAPFGSTRPIAVTADEPVEPLATLTSAARSTLLDEFQLVVHCGHDYRDADYSDAPVGDPSDVAGAIEFLEQLNNSGARHRDHEVGQPHPALLSKRVWTYAVCEQRREFLRAMHWWPLSGSAVVIDASDRSHTDAAALAAFAATAEHELQHNDVVVIANPAATTSFTALATARNDSPPHSLFVIPTAASSIEDRIAAYAGALQIISTAPAVIAVAASYSRRCNEQPADHTATNEHIDALDLHFDNLFSETGHAPVRLIEHHALQSLRAANAERTAQLVHERVVFADVVRALRNQLEAQNVQQAHQPGGALRRLAQRGRRVLQKPKQQ